MDDSEAADAFTALADETRLATLRALVRADRPLRFSDLRERVGVRDSGRFNYHLRRLVGRFVEKRDGRYELTDEARRLLVADGETDTDVEVRLSSPW